MSATPSSDCIILVIDTNQYTGNYVRQLCAFITGQLGECGVGREETQDAHEDVAPQHLDWFENNIRQVPDDHGCYRPCSIWKSVGDDQYRSVAVFFDVEPPQAIIDLFIERAEVFVERYNKGRATHIQRRITGKPPEPLQLRGINHVQYKVVIDQTITPLMGKEQL